MASDQSSVISTTVGDLSVVKSYNEGDYPHPAIEYHFEIWGSEPQEVTMIEPIPDFAEMDDIGIHPDHRSDWKIYEGNLVFQRRIDPDEEFSTAYTYRHGLKDRLSEWLTEPQIEVGEQAEVSVNDSDAGDPVIGDSNDDEDQQTAESEEDGTDDAPAAETGDGDDDAASETEDTKEPTGEEESEMEADGEVADEETEPDQAENGMGETKELDRAADETGTEDGTDESEPETETTEETEATEETEERTDESESETAEEPTEETAEEPTEETETTEETEDGTDGSEPETGTETEEESDAQREVSLPDPHDCYERVRRARFGETVSCVYCGESDPVVKNGTTGKGAQQYRCKECETYFNDLTDSFFERRKFPIEEMFYMLEETGSTPTTQIASDLGRDYDAVLNFHHDLQERCGELDDVTLSDVCEADEIDMTTDNKDVEKEEEEPSAASDDANTNVPEADENETPVARTEAVTASEIGQKLLHSITSLQETLEQTSRDGGQYKARIRQLETEFSELKAYTSALEEFLAENGTGKEIIESTREDIDTIQAQVEALQADTENHSTVLADLRKSLETAEAELTDRLEEHDDAIADLEERASANENDIADVANEVESLSESLAELSEEMDDRLDTHATERESLADQVDDYANKLADFSAQLDRISDDVTNLENRLSSDGDVGQRITHIEDRLDEFDEWRENLTSGLVTEE